MLIRFLVKNLFSFKELTEFNMLPGRFSRLPHHVYKNENVDLLKLNVMYGANGAGKSNMIKAMALLKESIVEGEMPIEIITQTFKFDKESKAKDVYLGIEFIQDQIPYYYGLTINQGIIIEEELQISGLGTRPDKTLFIRTDNVANKNLKVEFSEEVKSNPETALFPAIFQNEILERNKLVLSYMEKRQSSIFENYRQALIWISNLEVIFPQSKAAGLALRLEANKDFKNFATQTMQSFHTGAGSIHVATGAAEQFFGEDDKHQVEIITAELKANPGKVVTHNTAQNEELVFLLKNGKPIIKKILLTHQEDNGNSYFQLSEESDGTRRLLEYLPVFYNVVKTNKTFVIDEIERSIHPLLIKELIKKFSHDENTKGQLIFSTHESNLLDQEIFRPDEIWFAEKNKEGATEFNSLSDFKEHHTIDIRKGYLNGRYGAIPFLGNLKDLNWDKHAEA